MNYLAYSNHCGGNLSTCGTYLPGRAVVIRRASERASGEDPLRPSVSLGPISRSSIVPTGRPGPLLPPFAGGADRSGRVECRPNAAADKITVLLCIYRSPAEEYERAVRRTVCDARPSVRTSDRSKIYVWKAMNMRPSNLLLNSADEASPGRGRMGIKQILKRGRSSIPALAV